MRHSTADFPDRLLKAFGLDDRYYSPPGDKPMNCFGPRHRLLDLADTDQLPVANGNDIIQEIPPPHDTTRVA